MSEIKNFATALNGGMDSDTANEHLPVGRVRYALNCIVSSSSEGEEGVVTNPKGNTLISVSLPEGENKTIGAVADEENNRFFYAVWNSKGFHTWFQYDSVSNAITRIIQSKFDSNGEDIFKWNKTDLILGVNIIDGDKLYWTVYGSDHPARKININKMVDREAPGYDDIIQSSYTLAYKEPPVYAPRAVYFTNPDLKSNNVFGNLFKFATRYIYDDYEFSTFSDFSTVPVPDEEDVTGTKGVPLINNGIRVSFLTGNPLVRKIELVMKKTNPYIDAPNSENDWVSLVVLDKDTMNIPDDSEYEYEFYNDHSYISVNQEEVIMPYSELPDYPKSQDYSGNVILYGNFKSGFPTVRADVDLEVVYEDLFVPDSTENVPNNPSLTYNVLEVYYESGGFFSKGWRHKRGELIVGPDVKAGNVFTFRIDKGNGEVLTFPKVATLNDTASTIASYFQGILMSMDQATKSGGFVGPIRPAGGGAYKFEFNMWNNGGRPYIEFYTSVTPVNYAKLKDTGNSVRNEKHGSAFRYGIMYEAVDTSKKSLVYADVDNLVSIDNISDFGEIKKISTIMTVNHKAPYWAKRWQVVRTKNLVKRDYIQILVQAKATVTDSDDNQLYQDLIIGSLFTYQNIHPGTSVRFPFEKGDRVRLLKTYSDVSDSWTVETNVIDYDVINYQDVVTSSVDANVTIDGTNKVVVGDTPDPNNIGSYIRINNSERLITGIDGSAYTVEYPFTEQSEGSNSNRTYPVYEIINRRGVLRIKENPEYPIDVINGQKYALIEVYKPSQSFANIENENYYAIGYKFDVVEIDGQFYHRGNVQDQDPSNPAIVKIEGFDNYVRNRQLPTNNSVKDTQMIFTSIEDSSYSDFYVSDLTSYGRVNRLDDARGVTNFRESIIHSQNRIEGTKVNGLSMFRNTNRRDYNDKYGSIERLMFHDSTLYVLKNLKICYLPVNASIITDTSGQTGILSASDNVIPKRIEYVRWEDGVGKNPESAFRWGDEMWLICPNSGVVLRIVGASGDVVSTPLKFDKEIRDKVTAASIFGAKILGGFDPYLKYAVWNIEGYEIVAFRDGWFSNNSEVVKEEVGASWSIVSNPENGTVSLGSDNLIYSPAQNFSGMDYFSYTSTGGIVRNVAVNVLSADTEISWIPSGQFCVESGGNRTGEVGYSLLLEFDNISQTYTGESKPNESGDPDYVAPVTNLDICPLGIEFTRVAVLSAEKNSQSIEFKVTTADPVNIQIRAGQSSDGAIIDETGAVGSGTYVLDAPISTGEYSVYVSSPTLNYDGITAFEMKGAYIKTARFNDLPEITQLVLNQSAIPDAHNLVFNSLDITQNNKLVKLHVIKHKISGFNFGNNPILQDINVSYGSNLTSLTNLTWSAVRQLRIHNSQFTSPGYTTSFIDSIITSFNAAVPSPSSGYILQYGLSNASGIKPSSSVLAAYNSLISKGVSVVGVPPASAQATVYVSEGFNSDMTSRMAWVNLSQPLSVNINVHVEVQYFDSGFPEGNGFADITVYAGQVYGESNTSFLPNPGQTNLEGNITFASVDPNPAGGLNLILNY